MSEATTPQCRNLQFAGEDQAIAEIERLRVSGYKQLGKWTLPMIAFHLSARGQYNAPASPTATPEQAERKAKFVDVILQTGRPPANFEAPPETTPDPAKANNGDVDKLIESLRALKAFAHPLVDFGPFGPVPTEEVRKLVLGHTAHHLSFLLPAARRKLAINSEDEAIGEVERLRKSGYVQNGSWSLPQIAYHLQIPIDQFLSPAPDDAQPNADQRAMQTRFLDVVYDTGALPANARNAPPAWQPPKDASDADVERFIGGMKTLKAFKHKKAILGPMGPAPTDRAKKLFFVHAAHHLSFLAPKGARRDGLKYETIDAAIADVERLRRGHTQAGNWSFGQACWHLNVALQSRMHPAPEVPDTAEQIARRPMMEETLRTGALPSGLPAPDAFQPPADVDESSAADAFIAMLKTFRDYRGRIASHRLFGQLPDADARKLNLIHVAHHLSHFAPTSPTHT